MVQGGWHLRLTIALLIGFLALPLPSASAQSPASGEQTEPQDKLIARRIEFEGNRSVSSETLRQLVRTRTNRTLFGINGLTPWYFIHRVTGRFGEPPVHLDREVAYNDIERIRLFYESIGFFDAVVDTSVGLVRKGQARLVFIITEGPQSRIRELSYSGMPTEINEGTRARFFRQGFSVKRGQPETAAVIDIPYSLQSLRDEQDRIVSFLKDHGYASAQRDSVRLQLRPDPMDPTTLDARFTVHPGPRYVFGGITTVLEAPPQSDTNLYDTVSVAMRPSVGSSGDAASESIMTFIRETTARTRSGAITDALNFVPGQLYSQRDLQNSVNELQNLGMLSVTRFGLEDPVFSDSAMPALPVFIELATRPKHTLRTEIFGMERYGYGSGFGLNYSNNNVALHGEDFSLRLNTSLEYVTSSTLRSVVSDPSSSVSTDATLFQSYDATLQYSVPRLNPPFRRWDRHPMFRNAVTRYSLSFNRANQLYFDINSDVRFNLRYEVNHTPTLSSSLDLFELAVIDTDPSAEFEENLNLQFPDDPFQISRIKEDFRPQVSSLVRYTYRDNATDLIRRDRGHMAELSLTIGGNLPYLMDRWVVTPGTLEGNLPSPFGISSNALDYNQFIKLTADYRRYVTLLPDLVVAYRVFGGLAQPFRASQSVPLSQRFFAGGSNDIRAWPPFRLGPGALRPEEVTINGGEIKLAAFGEIRSIAFRDVLAGDWHAALFVDAGNVWYGPGNVLRDDSNRNLLRQGTFYADTFMRQIAVGSGLGIRIDWEFVVARVDFAFRIHDMEQGWFQNRKMYFNFGVGHSF